MNPISNIAQLISMPDHGPIYRETAHHLSRFIVEPWNAFSSLTFLIPAFIFLWQLRGRYASFPFVVCFCVPLLIFGGLGSTLFHAFRSSTWLLLMDALPIVLLVVGISIWMWLKVLSNKWLVVPIVVVFVALTFLARLFLNGQDQISAGYAVRGTMLLLPCFLFQRKIRFRNTALVVSTTLFFALALLFRFMDEKIAFSWMPWGTHWLWHVSTAFGAYYLGKYLISNSNEKVSSLEK